MASTIKSVGYIGLGNIGKPAARHLIGERYLAHVYDIFPEPVKELAAAGAVGCDGVGQLARACEHIGICVRDESQVEALLYGEEGIFANAQTGTVLAIHSTVSRDAILQWAQAAREKQLTLIDAGISGGAQGAEAGTLVYMVGGDIETVERARPVFETSAASVIHAGELGAGMVLKLCNNLITYAQFMAMSEATRLAEACGMSADTLREVGKGNGVVNEQMHLFISNRNALSAGCSEEEMAAIFGPFGELGEKDLACALACAAQLQLDLPSTARLHESVYNLFVNKA
jgi:3-hydroxyisobutyrate dehydrogenase